MQQGAGRILAISILAYLIFGLLGTSGGFCQMGERDFRFQYGLSVIGGVGEEDNTDVRYYAAYPRFGWLPHDRWRLELEGNFGHYRLESTDMNSLGLNGLVAYDILQLEYFSAFIAGGGGLFYRDVESREQLENGPVLGLAQAGLGLSFPSAINRTLPACIRSLR